MIRKFKKNLSVENNTSNDYLFEFAVNDKGKTYICDAIRVRSEGSYISLAFRQTGGEFVIVWENKGGWAYPSFQSINIINCKDKVANAWLLANTEGVSV